MHPLVKQATVSPCCGAPTIERRMRKHSRYVCKKCKHDCNPAKLIVQCNLEPAYGRRPVSQEETLDWFYRGMDYQISPHGPYTSVRDMANGAQIQFRHGKRLQKAFVHTVDLKLKK